MVSGGSAGIYLSGAAASVRRNTLTGALQHGISVVGDVRGSQIEGNTVAGRGRAPSTPAGPWAGAASR